MSSTQPEAPTAGDPTAAGPSAGRRLEIDLWLDLGCPWCYLGWHRLDRAIEAAAGGAEVAVTLRSFELNPDMPTSPVPVPDYLATTFAGTVARAREADGQVAALASADGLPYTTDRMIARTFDVHRVLHLAREHGVANPMFRTLQRGYFGGELDPFDPQALAGVAAGAGVPAEQARATVTGDGYADAVRHELAAGRSMGITGVPFTVLGGAYAVMGAQSVETYADAIRAALAG